MSVERESSRVSLRRSLEVKTRLSGFAAAAPKLEKTYSDTEQLRGEHTQNKTCHVRIQTGFNKYLKAF